jgi:hypothetical protein
VQPAVAQDNAAGLEHHPLKLFDGRPRSPGSCQAMLCPRNRGAFAATAASRRLRVPSRRIRLFAAPKASSCLRSSGRSVSSLTKASGANSTTASHSADRSKTSQTIGSAPSWRNGSPFSGERVIPATSWPAQTSSGTSRTPITPLAPATKTRITAAVAQDN